MNTHAEDAKLAEYARKLRWALSALPEQDRDSIVAETRSHVLDRVDAGASVAEALAALGPPEDYARGFRESYAVATAISSRRLPQLISALLHNAARSLAVAVTGVVIFIAWAVAAIAVYLAALKISDPAHVGLWRGEGFFFIGIIDDPSTGQELLGPWLPAIALLFILIAWGMTHLLGVWALKRLKPSR
jgi:uncharacterized membrane protein